MFWLLVEGEEHCWGESTFPGISLWSSINSFGGEISLAWSISATILKNKGSSVWGNVQHSHFMVVGSPAERSSKGWAWAWWGGDASTVHDCFQEEWKPWRCPADVCRSQSCYHMTGSLGSCWVQPKVSPGTRQMMNLGCKILCAPLPFWPVILYHMSSGLQIPIKQQFATLDL